LGVDIDYRHAGLLAAKSRASWRRAQDLPFRRSADQL
jgi:hypothetical protein